MIKPGKINIEQWDELYQQLLQGGLVEPSFGGNLNRHIADGDLRLLNLQYDNSVAALNLWNFLLSEEDRLHQHRQQGRKIVGAMKDLGTVPVLAYCFDELIAFYPDGAWWIPCVMELNDGLFGIADALGIDESFCPVRAMLGAFVTEEHFPIPDLLICSTGAVCDDFSAIAQRLAGMGHPILWWEIPHRRRCDVFEKSTVVLPGGFVAATDQVEFVKMELERIKSAMEQLAGHKLSQDALRGGIARANEIRFVLAKLRQLVFGAELCPMPALEMLIAEMMIIHYCSDIDQAQLVLQGLLDEVENRLAAGVGVLPADAAKVFWLNPVADLQIMNLLEDCGGRICGTEYLFNHSLEPIAEDIEPMEALARTALADPMIGSATDRAAVIMRDIKAYDCEALVISRIPGASHCASEAVIIGDIVAEHLDIPVVEIEVPPLSKSIQPALRTRLEALVETVKQRRK